MGVRYFIRGREEGTQWIEVITGLSLRPLSASFQLKFPFRHIMRGTIASDISFCFFDGRKIPGIFTDDNSQFHFPICFLTFSWNQNRIKGTYYRIGSLLKYDRFSWYGHAGFGGVVGVIQTDAKDFSGPCYTGAPPYLLPDIRQGRDILQALQFAEPVLTKEFPVPIFENGG